MGCIRSANICSDATLTKAKEEAKANEKGKKQEAKMKRKRDGIAFLDYM